MNLHFWLHTSGLLLYVMSMWAAGVTQGLMWRATNADGSLTYDFLSSLIATQPYYLARFLGGVLVLSGMVVMAWNLWHTAADARAGVIKPILVPAPEVIPEPVPDQIPPPLPAKGLSMGCNTNIGKSSRRTRACSRVLIAIMVSFGGLAEIMPLFNDAQTVEAGAGRQALRAAAPRRQGCVRARGLLSVPFADDPHAELRNAALRRTFRLPVNSSTTDRSSGARSAPGRTWRASAANIPTPGSARTCWRRASSCRSRTCPAIRGWRKRRSTATICRRACARCACSAIRTATQDRGRTGCGARQDRARRTDRLSTGPGREAGRMPRRHCRGDAMSELYGHFIGVMIVLIMLMFIGIWIWAWLPHHKKEFARTRAAAAATRTQP